MAGCSSEPWQGDRIATRRGASTAGFEFSGRGPHFLSGIMAIQRNTTETCPQGTMLQRLLHHAIEPSSRIYVNNRVLHYSRLWTGSMETLPNMGLQRRKLRLGAY
jgi:hypothetical protein